MRHPARKGKADSNQPAIKQAIELLGYPVMVLSAAGNGVEDLLVGLKRTAWEPGPQMVIRRWWVMVEIKVPRNKRGEMTESQLTKTQKEWRAMTEGWPRITATSAQDAVDQIRAMTDGVPLRSTERADSPAR